MFQNEAQLQTDLSCSERQSEEWRPAELSRVFLALATQIPATRQRLLLELCFIYVSVFLCVCVHSWSVPMCVCLRGGCAC